MTTLSRMKWTSAYKAAEIIFDEGPIQPSVLFTRVDFGVTGPLRKEAVGRAVESGILVYSATGALDITPEVRNYFSALSDEETKETSKKHEGIPAAPRKMSVYERPAYVPPKRVIREDVPQWSKYPDGFRLYTIAG